MQVLNHFDLAQFSLTPTAAMSSPGVGLRYGGRYSEANAIFLRCQRDLKILSSIISSLIFIHVMWWSIVLYAAYRRAGGTLCISPVCICVYTAYVLCLNQSIVWSLMTFEAHVAFVLGEILKMWCFLVMRGRSQFTNVDSKTFSRYVWWKVLQWNKPVTACFYHLIWPKPSKKQNVRLYVCKIHII